MNTYSLSRGRSGLAGQLTMEDPTFDVKHFYENLTNERRRS